MADLGKTQKECYEIIISADPSSFVGRIDDWLKGGLPARSMGDGIRGNNAPTPEFDMDDAQAREALADYRENWAAILKALRGNRRLELVWAAIPAKNARRLAEEEQSPTAVGCKNCHRVVENTPNDRLRGGRCHACYEWWAAHGDERPKERWEAEIDRQLKVLTQRGVQPQGRKKPKAPCG